MAENLRAEYMSEVATRNAKGLQKIKALQRFFQVRLNNYPGFEGLMLFFSPQTNDDLLFLHTKMDRRIYK